MHRLALIALILPLVLVSLSGCKQEAGKTLSVTLGEPVPRQVPVGVSFSDAASVHYLGSKQLVMAWQVISSSNGFDNVGFAPVTGQVSSNTAGTALSFGLAGTYVIRVTVYELNGTLSASDEATYVAVNTSG